MNRLHFVSAMVLAVLSWPPGLLEAQEHEIIEVETADGITITAYDYASGTAHGGPYILLFHQAGGDARGEYGPIIPRLLDAGYDVLAADLRAGGDVFGGVNRTVEALGEAVDDYCQGLPDLEAVLAYARERHPHRKVILWGSSYSAALVVQLASLRPESVAGVLAFSPASGDPMAGCRPEPFADGLAVPLVAFRPEREAAIPSVAQQLETLRAMGHEAHVVAPGRHGSSMLVEDRVEGDTSEAWALVWDFLERLRGDAAGGSRPTNAMASP